MKCSFRGWQGKNKPAVTGVHSGKFENIAKESAVAFRILAVNDNVGSGDHGRSFALPWDSRHSSLSATAAQ
jgi:hypothetical protein